MTARSILSPVDFSDQSRHALRWASEFAERFQSRLTVLNVVDPLLVEAARIRLGQDLARETEPALREFVAAMWPDGAARPSLTIFTVRTGNPADVILDTATDGSADLIVMGTQGLGGVRKWILGSTTERVLRRSHTPVLAVPPAIKDSSEPWAGDLSRHVRRILIATDFSESSTTAAKYGAELSRELSVPLLFAHVVEATTVASQWRFLAEESDEARVADARVRLKRLAEPLSAQEYETVVSVGRPSDVIGSIAEDRQAGLIVMGLTGDGGPMLHQPGSIAYRVLGSAAVPVLVVPPQP